MEMYFAVSGMGAVLHTINPRLFPQQIEFIANHAEDTYVFLDVTFLPLVESLHAQAWLCAQARPPALRAAVWPPTDTGGACRLAHSSRQSRATC
jgi:acyl-CoA synthetase (AMP-forming)/AMP-acid ligase II